MADRVRERNIGEKDCFSMKCVLYKIKNMLVSAFLSNEFQAGLVETPRLFTPKLPIVSCLCSIYNLLPVSSHSLPYPLQSSSFFHRFFFI